MNEIESRRSIRKYRKEMPDRGLIDEILHAGISSIRTGSRGNFSYKRKNQRKCCSARWKPA